MPPLEKQGWRAFSILVGALLSERGERTKFEIIFRTISNHFELFQSIEIAIIYNSLFTSVQSLYLMVLE